MEKKNTYAGVLTAAIIGATAGIPYDSELKTITWILLGIVLAFVILRAVYWEMRKKKKRAAKKK